MTLFWCGYYFEWEKVSSLLPDNGASATDTAAVFSWLCSLSCSSKESSASYQSPPPEACRMTIRVLSKQLTISSLFHLFIMSTGSWDGLRRLNKACCSKTDSLIGLTANGSMRFLRHVLSFKNALAKENALGLVFGNFGDDRRASKHLVKCLIPSKNGGKSCRVFLFVCLYTYSYSFKTFV